MADRNQPYLQRYQMAPRVGAGVGAAVGAGTFSRTTQAGSGNPASSSTGVRRNLFRSQLTRRPTPAPSVGSGASSAGSSNDGFRGGGLDGSGSALGESGSVISDSKVCGPAEIIVRDHNGEVELVDPPSPPPDELNQMAPDAGQESDRERQRLADTIKYHQQRAGIPGHPEDLLEALRASLRAKVAALADDNWMYEPEDIPRLE